MKWPKYTWDPKARQYRDAKGRFVPRAAVRQALDEVIDAAAAQIADDALLLQEGAINLPEWQLRMEASLKAIHAASAAIAAGGWAQATAKDWSAAGNRLKKQYKFLDRFARQIEAGLPLDGRFLVRAASYATAGSGTYEKVLRQIDLASGLVLQERRILHSTNPCQSCVGYAALGWQDPGTLPGIGEECECGMRCRCSFVRRTLKAGSLKFAPSERAQREGKRTVWVDIAAIDRAFGRDQGFYVGLGGEGGIPGRSEAFKEFLAKAQAQGQAIEQPELVVDPNGDVSFINGRHRFAVLRDLGFTKIPVSVAKGAVNATRRLFGAKP